MCWLICFYFDWCSDKPDICSYDCSIRNNPYKLFLKQREIEYKNWLIDNIKSDSNYANDLNVIAFKYSKQEIFKIQYH